MRSKNIILLNRTAITDMAIYIKKVAIFFIIFISKATNPNTISSYLNIGSRASNIISKSIFSI